ncbi:MAG: hypothetical protein LC791_06680 [Acidobacteria bacterium]|nr:hypothetical protein [Acidobacteriota bacterium]
MAEQDETKGTRGGNEPPADVQDRPEQNRGYDEVVRGKEGVDQPPGPQDALAAESSPQTNSQDVDEQAAREAAADVRERDRSADRRADPGFRTKGG